VKPVRLQSALHEKIWGSTELQPWFAASERKIGEVWFTADPPLPILVKFLFTSDRLSVQVHPDDSDGEPGKTEMWYILRAGPGARIALGFREPLTREDLRRAACTGEIENLLEWFPVKAGDVYYAPAHTVHAIGGGLALCEIQQNCDRTYRLYDYGRPRELHLERAVALADLGRHPGAATPDGNILVRSPHFATESVRVAGELPYRSDPERFELLICVEGRGRIGAEPFAAGEVWMAPAGCAPFILRSERAHLLRSYVPPQSP
jgi:mannose-6-phosphate isomerase